MSETYLDDLAASISDIGVWTWWTEEGMPESFQVEFAWVQLLQKPQEANCAPLNKVAIRFTSPEVIAFLQFSDEGEPRPPSNWPDLLKKDQLEAQHIADRLLTFDSQEVASEVLNTSSVTSFYRGDQRALDRITEHPSFLIFRSGTVGLAVGAKAFEPVTFDGVLSPKQVRRMHADWWAYWRRYWELRDSSPLPMDPMCEVTIPVGKA